jgi:hypothetical protein
VLDHLLAQLTLGLLGLLSLLFLAGLGCLLCGGFQSLFVVLLDRLGYLNVVVLLHLLSLLHYLSLLEEVSLYYFEPKGPEGRSDVVNRDEGGAAVGRLHLGPADHLGRNQTRYEDILVLNRGQILEEN